MTFPQDLESTIHGVEKRATQSGFDTSGQGVSLSALFPEPELRNYARERMQMLHRGDLNSYLASLVSKERDSLGTNSASIMDLIHICEHKLNLRSIEFDKRYVVGETDLWIPAWALSIEVKNSWDEREELVLKNTLSNTNFRLQAKYLVVVVPDSLSDESFEMIRSVERSGLSEFVHPADRRLGQLPRQGRGNRKRTKSLGLRNHFFPRQPSFGIPKPAALELALAPILLLPFDRSSIFWSWFRKGFPCRKKPPGQISVWEVPFWKPCGFLDKVVLKDKLPSGESLNDGSVERFVFQPPSVESLRFA